MLTPGPDHPITITPATSRWRAKYGDHVIADTGDALILKEADYPAVVYFPRADVSMDFFSRTDRTTHCPYKGDAAYYTILMDGRFAENAVWTYEQPFPAMEQIRGRLAFYPDKVEVYQVDGAREVHHGGILSFLKDQGVAGVGDDVVAIFGAPPARGGRDGDGVVRAWGQHLDAPPMTSPTPKMGLR
ncbi:MAG: DUF427 domain-containing protein, partial [Caulobacteraceae bacterium]